MQGSLRNLRERWELLCGGRHDSNAKPVSFGVAAAASAAWREPIVPRR